MKLKMTDSHSSATANGQTDRAEETTEKSQTISSPRATPRTSNSSSSSPLADSPNRPGKYTSIDLENDLPEIYRTQLNPDIEDPDMSEFFSRPPPFFKNAPPVYYSRKASPSSTIQSHGRKPGKFRFPDKETRMRICLGLFVFVFFIIPIMMIFLFRVIPAFTE
nr:Protein W02D7.3 [Haemonchus contortus]